MPHRMNTQIPWLFVLLSQSDSLSVTRPLARVVGSSESRVEHVRALQKRGFVVVDDDTSHLDDVVTSYRWNSAVGMLQLVPSSSADVSTVEDSPKWISVVGGEEEVLVANGWSFLNTDESEAGPSLGNSLHDGEETYQPKWGDVNCVPTGGGALQMSALGYSLQPLSSSEILRLAESKVFSESSRQILLQGATDPPRHKITNNGIDLNGSLQHLTGVFVCPISDLPLFTTADLLPTTASDGWLSFYACLGDHVRLISPEKSSLDQRVEAVCGQSGCHLGHYFANEGNAGSYCINAGALNFIAIPIDVPSNHISEPVSYDRFDQIRASGSLSVKLLHAAIALAKEETA